MTNFRSSKRALFCSMLALLVCFTLLLGTTFAWFTDSATSTGNKIVAGTLAVELWQHTDTGSTNISEQSEAVFTDSILWEPGMTQVVYLSVKNAGNLALKYKLAIEVTGVSEVDLTEVLEYAIISKPDAAANNYGYVTAWDAAAGTKVEPGLNAAAVEDVALNENGDEDFFAIAVHMLETADNKYMGQSITFDIRVLAAQNAYENDSFGNQYDADATYDEPVIVPVNPNGATELKKVVDGQTIASAVVPADAVAEDATVLELVVDEDCDYVGNFTLAANQTADAYDVSVKGLAANNTTPIKVTLKAPAGLNPATVKLYHYDTEIACVYNPNNGYVNFETATFSPFTVVYDAESEYVPPVVEEPEYPVATVTRATEYENAAIEWGNFGGFTPDTTVDPNPMLEAAFVFKCPADLDADIRAAYEYWHCDFYVSLDRDLAANQILLGGNYGEFGWVGFHNGDVELAANEAIPLLGSVTNSPWTYADIESFVSTFICGVGDVNDALDGATFTVQLRLTNPEDESVFINVNTVTYTFGGSVVIDGVTSVTTGQGLQDAVNNGDSNIQLDGDIDLNEGLVIPGL